MKAKGIKKLNKVMTKYLSDFDIDKVKLGTTFAYYPSSNHIEFKLTETKEDEWFNEFVFERFGYNCEYPFILGLLHEIGHSKTLDIIEGGVYDFCYNEKDRISAEMKDANANRSKELEWQYFNLPDEILATAWAVDYAKKHPKKINKLWRKMQPNFIKFYRKNGLDEKENN